MRRRRSIAEHSLPLSAFRYWKKRGAHEAASEEASFIELPMTGAMSESIGDLCTIEFPNGCALKVHTMSAVQELAQLVAIVGGLLTVKRDREELLDLRGCITLEGLVDIGGAGDLVGCAGRTDGDEVVLHGYAPFGYCDGI